MSSSAWGDVETQYFYSLTPDRILDAVEASGLQCTGRCLQLNSMENRVYEIEIVLDDDAVVASPSDRFRVVKFYRPGRWSKEQILDEHQFLLDLQENDIPVAAPERFPDGETLHCLGDLSIYYCVFPKFGGRNPDELSVDQLEQLGRLLARMHNVGAIRPAPHRIQINPTTYGIDNLRYILDEKLLPTEQEKPYRELVEKICETTAPWFAEATYQRVHGDAHMGNLLWHPDRGPRLVDFDDMVMGPPVQDIWLATPGRDVWSIQEREILLEGYEQMRDFERKSLRLIEPLRALRFVHFHAWIGKRWTDQAFPRAFPHYGSSNYWAEAVSDLREQLRLIEEEAQKYTLH
ncbi:MAG: serine/threonine protein kinase [Myxococcales bacterium]|nr:serine/threonine protein kinase [Myxococcales bacterium]